MLNTNFYAPAKGTRQWEEVLANDNEELLAWLIRENINPRDISFLTLFESVDDPIKAGLTTRGGIFNLSDLATSVDTIDAETDPTWKRHKVRRLDASVTAFMNDFSEDILEDSVLNELKKEASERLVMQWSGQDQRLPTEIIERLKQIIPDVYRDSYMRWYETRDTASATDRELLFWQTEVMNHLTTNKYLGQNHVLNRILNEFKRQQILDRMKRNQETFSEKWDELYEQMISSLISQYENEEINRELAIIIRDKTRTLLSNCKDTPKPHIDKFYREGIHELFLAWQMDNKDKSPEFDRWLNAWIRKLEASELRAIVPSEVIELLDKLGIEKVIEDYKMKKFRDQPLDLILDAALCGLYQARNIDKIHTTADGALSINVVMALLDMTFAKDDEQRDDTDHTLIDLVIEPWSARSIALNEWRERLQIPRPVNQEACAEDQENNVVDAGNGAPVPTP